jgi:diguanylate cyclase (GGDEF)-like protein
MTGWIRRWWRQPDRFDWFAGYLKDRHLQHAARASVAGVTAAFSAVAAAMLWSPAGPHETWPKVGGATAAIAGAMMALLWLVRWPILVQSRLYVFFANASVAVACLSQSDPLAGLTGCYAFIVLGAYIALMHCAKATSYNFVVGLGVAAILVWRVAQCRGDIILAACEMVILVVFSVGAPVALRTMLLIMSTDILRSDCDALTGLLNRRGFYRHTIRLIDYFAQADVGYLTITMIDLDHFKQVNDNHGHLAGDIALIAVGRALHAISGPSSVVARVGGEEFLVADLCAAHRPTLGARVCGAIADAPHGITASVGTAGMLVAQLDHQDRTHLIDQLIARADAAMYVAKNAGGNQHQHYLDSCPIAPTPASRPKRPTAVSI